jgi:hypothetical protein
MQRTDPPASSMVGTSSSRMPREIAHDLNKERVPPPRGRAWNASTINGNRQRCAGILQMSTNGQDKSGRVRIRCSAAKESGICSDAKTFYLDAAERALLGGLRAELRAPKVIAEFVRTYLEERKRLAASSNAKRQRLEQQLGQLNREIDRLCGERW